MSWALRRTRSAVRSRRVRFTQKAIREIAELQFDERDVCDVLLGLQPTDFHSQMTATATPDDLFVFKPRVVTVRLYVKLLLREQCVVISFHEDEPDATKEISA